MRRIRLVFLLLAVVLLVPLALLVRKALTSAASERSAQHRAVAERVFDEMERELTTFLRREESRPFEHYRHFYLPETPVPQRPLGGNEGGGLQAPEAQEDDVLPDGRRRSPISGPPAEGFVLGYFQIHPDGTFSTPHRTDSEDWSRSTEVEDWVGRLEEVVGYVWRQQEGETAPPDAAALRPPGGNEGGGLQVAGSTVELGSKKAASKEYLQERFLDSLNRGAVSRNQRWSKNELTQAPNVYGYVSEVSDVTVEPSADRYLQPNLLDVRLEPMVGRPAAAGILALYRTVAVGQRAYRQGLLVDMAMLVDWLRDRVLIDRELASRAAFALDSDPPSTDFPGYSYRHRFAEPFGSVLGSLFLEGVPDLGTALLYALSLLLGLAATVGLLALYRMVAVVVEYSERRNNFVSAVTHELKTPLTAIRMYGEMLRDGVVPDESKRQQYYETITSETERLTRLLQNVLELARLDNDARTMNLVVGNAEEVLAEVVGVLGPHAAQQGFALRVESEPDLPQVRYDRDALIQVIFNLLDNALKYSRKAERKEIVLSCRAEGDGVALAVTDFGPGVAREHLAKIFEPFYRGENELTRTSKGTGIGLALVRGLVERMGGHVGGRNLGAGGFEVVVSLGGSQEA